MLNSTKHEISTANKYENAIFIFISRKINHVLQCLARNNLQYFLIWNLLAEQISSSAELSMKKVL